jgi:hypothetical protein
MADLPPLDPVSLPAGIRARFVEGVNGLRMHLLEAGHEEPGRPCLLLLHGFPELAYSWGNGLRRLASVPARTSGPRAVCLATAPRILALEQGPDDGRLRGDRDLGTLPGPHPPARAPRRRGGGPLRPRDLRHPAHPSGRRARGPAGELRQHGDEILRWRELEGSY